MGTSRKAVTRNLGRDAQLLNLRRALNTLTAGDDAVVHAKDEIGLVKSMCRAVVEKGGYRYAWVGYAENDEAKSVRRIAEWGASAGYATGLVVSWGAGPVSLGPSGRCLKTGLPAISDDNLEDPAYKPWRAHAMRFGHRSSLAVPLRVHGAVIGFLAIYSELPRAFAGAPLSHLRRLGEHLAFGIERLRDAVRLERSEALYCCLIEGVPGYVYRCRADSPTTPVYVSPQVEHILGYTPAQRMTEDSRSRVVHPQDRDRVIDQFRASVTSGRPFQAEYRVTDAEGATRWVRDHAVRVPDRPGEKNVWQGVVIDITSSRQTAEEARNVASFLATTSHEIRTPLNSILGFSQLLLEPGFGELDDRQRRYVDHVATAGRQLLDLINDILDLAKVKANRLELEPAVIDAEAVLVAAADQVASLATTAGIDIFIRRREPASVVADERALRQILLNLLSNAIKFTPPGGRVELGWAADEHDRLKLLVVDTGRGIAPENLELIFDEYSQVGARPGDSKGTGLGLALSRRLAELMGGTLTVQSRLGAGSTFAVSLPRSSGSPARERAAGSPTELS